jgi:dTDP-4-amino-4,6-dideoxygalactose transaminase
MSQLALLGGKPVIDGPLPRYRSVGEGEKRAVIRVIEDDCLSGFYGNWCDEFFGGPRVREFEEKWARRFGVRHAVSVNSATSGLMAAMGAVGVQPGDEVIVPPYTMSATAVAPLLYGGIPVFADIEAETFCLDVGQVRALIGPRTKAILAVNLFGHPARLAELRRLADERGIYLVEDNAQGPLASEDGRFAGTVGHIGVFSLNYHKHIHTGEGGVCVTDDDDLCLRLQMIRNHAENIVDPLGRTDLANLVGFNWRLTELSAAVGLVQLERAEEQVGRRERLALRLSAGMEGLEGLRAPAVRPGCRHVFYAWSLRLDEEVLGVSRAQFSRALAAEGFPHGVGYVAPLYLLPVFQRRIAFGAHPFNLTARTYPKGLCPVTERLHERELLGYEICAYRVDDELADRLIACIRKVHRGRAELAAARAEGDR